MSTPYRTRLQLDFHCCDCGKLLPKDSLAVLCTTSVNVSIFSVGHLIGWCDPCWKEFAGSLGDSIRVIDPHAEETQNVQT